MIYDAFMFYDEFDMLELRLNELDGCVDKFILSETTWTHQLKPKPLAFAENRDRFAKFDKKIIYLGIDGIPSRVVPGHSAIQYQRGHMINGLKDCKPTDLVMISDLDEIPKPHEVSALASVIQPLDKWVFKHDTYCYFLNMFMTENWLGTTMVTCNYLSKVYHDRLDKLRFARKKLGTGRVQSGGWHFTFMGGVDEIVKKLKAYGDTEWTTDEMTDPKRIAACMRKGVNPLDPHPLAYVPINSSHPKYVRDNLDKFKRYIWKP